MNNSNSKKIRIISLYRNEFVGDKGEDVCLCKITYALKVEPTDKFVGSESIIQQVKGVNFEKLTPYVDKEVIAYYKDKIDNKNKSFKSVIYKIDNIDL